MDKEDARYQTMERLHERRRQFIRLHKRGIKVMELVQMPGLSSPAVRKVLDLFKHGRWPAIKPAGRGRTKGDEPALVNTDVRGRSYAPAGETPVAYKVGSALQKLSMITTVTNQGKARWMTIDEDFNTLAIRLEIEVLPSSPATVQPRS